MGSGPATASYHRRFLAASRQVIQPGVVVGIPARMRLPKSRSAVPSLACRYNLAASSAGDLDRDEIRGLAVASKWRPIVAREPGSRPARIRTRSYNGADSRCRWHPIPTREPPGAWQPWEIQDGPALESLDRGAHLFRHSGGGWARPSGFSRSTASNCAGTRSL